MNHDEPPKQSALFKEAFLMRPQPPSASAAGLINEAIDEVRFLVWQLQM